MVGETAVLERPAGGEAGKTEETRRKKERASRSKNKWIGGTALGLVVTLAAATTFAYLKGESTGESSQRGLDRTALQTVARLGQHGLLEHQAGVAVDSHGVLVVTLSSDGENPRAPEIHGVAASPKGDELVASLTDSTGHVVRSYHLTNGAEVDQVMGALAGLPESTSQNSSPSTTAPAAHQNG